MRAMDGGVSNPLDGEIFGSISSCKLHGLLVAWLMLKAIFV